MKEELLKTIKSVTMMTQTNWFYIKGQLDLAVSIDLITIDEYNTLLKELDNARV